MAGGTQSGRQLTTVPRYRMFSWIDHDVWNKIIALQQSLDYNECTSAWIKYVLYKCQSRDCIIHSSEWERAIVL